MKSAVFVDRDGVLNEDKKYASFSGDAKLFPGVASAIKRLNEAGMKVIVVSNQSGIARGYHTEEDTRAFNAELDAQLRAKGARVDGWYYCPHFPEGTVSEYAKECECRKPKAGMLFRAAQEHNVNLSKSFMVGDKMSDIEAGISAGTQTILVGHEVSSNQLKSLIPILKVYFKYREHMTTGCAKDLSEAVGFILQRVVA